MVTSHCMSHHVMCFCFSLFLLNPLPSATSSSNIPSLVWLKNNRTALPWLITIYLSIYISIYIYIYIYIDIYISIYIYINHCLVCVNTSKTAYGFLNLTCNICNPTRMVSRIQSMKCRGSAAEFSISSIFSCRMLTKDIFCRVSFTFSGTLLTRYK